MRMTHDEQPDDTDVTVTAACEAQAPDASTVDEPAAEDTTAGDEEAGYGYGV